MQFGWLTLGLSPSPEEDEVRIDQQIEQVCCAEALGFSDVWLTEHYFTGESVYNDSLMFAAALAMKTSRIRLGFAVVQTPFHHPVRLATQLALLDNLSKGRIDVGVGKGTVYNEYEFVGHGLRSDDSRERDLRPPLRRHPGPARRDLVSLRRQAQRARGLRGQVPERLPAGPRYRATGLGGHRALPAQPGRRAVRPRG